MVCHFYPKSNISFRIMNTSVAPKRTLTALEFGDNLNQSTSAVRTDITIADNRLAVMKSCSELQRTFKMI